MTQQSIFEMARVDRRSLFNMDRLKEGMRRENLDALIAVSPANITYTGGVNWADRAHSLGFVITAADGTQGVVINEADYYHFKAVSWIKDLRPVRYTPSETDMKVQAARLVAEMLKEMGLDKGRIGVEVGWMTMANYETISRSAPKATLVSGEPAFNYARVIKTPAEIELFSRAAYITDKAIATAFAQTRVGDTEKDVAARMQSNILWMGADLLTNNAETNSGPRGAQVHTWPREVPIQPGEVIHSDFGGQFGGYLTDMSRMAVVQKASPKQESIYNLLWEIQQSIFAEIKPGVTAGELWEVAERGFEKAGFPHAWGTIGHSTGLETHEGFHISKGSKAVIEPNMILNVEPSRVEPELGRFTIEDTVLVTENGIERLTKFTDTRSMFVIK